MYLLHSACYLAFVVGTQDPPKSTVFPCFVFFHCCFPFRFTPHLSTLFACEAVRHIFVGQGFMQGHHNEQPVFPVFPAFGSPCFCVLTVFSLFSLFVMSQETHYSQMLNTSLAFLVPGLLLVHRSGRRLQHHPQLPSSSECFISAIKTRRLLFQSSF